MSVEGIAGLAIALAVVLLGVSAFLFFRESWFMQWLRGTVGFLLVGCALWLVLFAASLFAFERVEGDAPLATVSFERLGDQSFRATVAARGGDRYQYDLGGDLWRLDVRVLRWRGLFAGLGATPLYQLDEISGRFLSLEDEAAQQRSVFGLAPSPVLGYDLWQRVHTGWSMALVASRASVVLVPMADGAIYEVRMGETGLAAQAANSAAEDALRQVTGE